MSVKQFCIVSGGIVALSAEACDRLLATRDGDAALLYLYIHKNSGLLDEPAAMRKLGFTRTQLADSVKKLETAGLLSDGPVPASIPAVIPNEVPPAYSAGDLARGMDGDPAFRHLVDEAQRRLGKVLSQADLATLFGIYDRMGFPANVLSLLITHCVGEAKSKYGEGRMPTMRQIEREAVIWEQRGILDEARAEEHLIELQRRKTAAAQVMRALQINGRAASVSEERYINEWLEMGFGVDLIYRAYDITVLKTGGLKWSYLNSILKSWHEKNLHTPEQVEQGDRPQEKKPRTESRHEPGAHELRALEWLKNYNPAGRDKKEP